MTPTQRFWSHVNRRGTNECWLWGKAGGVRGYMRWRGKVRLAYRIAWELAHGAPPPDDLCVCHTCDNGQCVNPAHLFLGTKRDNTRDMMSKGRHKPIPVLWGEAHVKAYIGDETVRKVRESYAAGETAREIAARLDLRYPTVQSWISGRTRVTAGGPIRTTHPAALA